ncbi:uncharacterized protein RCC_05632 [Ramularia collo-cygni]|uniref:Uncharacterized protein n=1 Tax=Ramularia collo-cygni TaxID=112498 RepID=A0A2D3V4Z9_9PEZI|nr:uncharacterized protein RCC_05632 [Ramularia collo-cygni]CZT19777.1 uncharacterized protein RCC_05632 [Ramularia collo-cygni]
MGLYILYCSAAKYGLPFVRTRRHAGGTLRNVESLTHMPAAVWPSSQGSCARQLLCPIMVSRLLLTASQACPLHVVSKVHAERVR